MDPFSAEGELINIHNHFHQSQYQQVIDSDTSTLSPDSSLLARLITLRARLALGQHADVLEAVQGATEPELQAVAALALYLGGAADAGLEKAEELAVKWRDNSGVQVVCGTVLAAAGKSEEALELLSAHESNIDAVALIIQIHLQRNRSDLALKEVTAARRWGQDSLLVNLAESWVGMRLGGERYQQAFYVFEELAQAPATTSVRSRVSQAVAELHLGRLEEAQAALTSALEKEPACADAIANLLVLKTIAGEDGAELTEKLMSVDATHQLLTDLQEKDALFDKAASKYKAKAVK